MENENHKLINIIVFIGIVISIVTTFTLPTLDWDQNKNIEPIVKEKIENKYLIPKRVSSSF